MLSVIELHVGLVYFVCLVHDNCCCPFVCFLQRRGLGPLLCYVMGLKTNNTLTKIVPRIDYKKGYSYHVSNQAKVSGCSENHKHSLSCLHSVIKYLIKMY